MREVEELVSWCFKPSQLQRIVSGLRETFTKRYIVKRTNKAEKKAGRTEQEGGESSSRLLMMRYITTMIPPPPTPYPSPISHSDTTRDADFRVEDAGDMVLVAKDGKHHSSTHWAATSFTSTFCFTLGEGRDYTEQKITTQQYDPILDKELSELVSWCFEPS